MKTNIMSKGMENTAKLRLKSLKNWLSLESANSLATSSIIKPITAVPAIDAVKIVVETILEIMAKSRYKLCTWLQKCLAQTLSLRRERF